MAGDEVIFKAALSAMQRLCSRREYCTGDIQKRLSKYNLDPEQMHLISTSLAKDGFVDDLRFARAFVRDKTRLSGWGAKKIAWTLKGKGVADDIIKESLNEIPSEGEADRLELILMTKLKSMKKATESCKLRASLIRFALSRGFGYEHSVGVVNKIVANFVEE